MNSLGGFLVVSPDPLTLVSTPHPISGGGARPALCRCRPTPRTSPWTRRGFGFGGADDRWYKDTVGREIRAAPKRLWNENGFPSKDGNILISCGFKVVKRISSVHSSCM